MQGVRAVRSALVGRGANVRQNLDGDEADEKPVDEKKAAVIKEGYLRKKKPGNSKVQDMKRSWERRYFVLYNDGKLKYYDSRMKKQEKGSLDLRFFALQEVEEEIAEDTTTTSRCICREKRNGKRRENNQPYERWLSVKSFLDRIP